MTTSIRFCKDDFQTKWEVIHKISPSMRRNVIMQIIDSTGEPPIALDCHCQLQLPISSGVYLIIIWLIRRVLLFYCIMGSRLSKRRWRWLEYLFTMWLQFSQWRENLWDGFFLRNHQSCTGGASEPRISPRDSYLSLILEICLSDHLCNYYHMYSSIHTQKVIATCAPTINLHYMPFCCYCYKPSISIQRYVWMNELQLWRHENYQMSSPTRFEKVSPVSQLAETLAIPPGGQSQATAARVQLPGWTGD